MGGFGGELLRRDALREHRQTAKVAAAAKRLNQWGIMRFFAPNIGFMNIWRFNFSRALCMAYVYGSQHSMGFGRR
jgi:hypothetical protein